MDVGKKIVVRSANVIQISEAQILMVQLAANDMKQSEIAHELKLNPRTIEAHFGRIKEKFNCKTIPGLVAYFFREGLIK